MILSRASTHLSLIKSGPDPRDAMLASAAASHGPVSVCLSVCLSQIGVPSKRLNESSWVLAWELRFTRPYTRTFGYLQR